MSIRREQVYYQLLLKLGYRSALDADGQIMTPQTPLDKLVNGEELYEVWIQPGECHDKDLEAYILSDRLNLILVSNKQRQQMTPAMRHEAMIWSLQEYSEQWINAFLQEIQARGYQKNTRKDTVATIMARKH